MSWYEIGDGNQLSADRGMIALLNIHLVLSAGFSPGGNRVVLADAAAIYDNSDGQGILIAERSEHSSLIVHDADRWATIEGARP